MNCHDENAHHNKYSHIKHILHMFLCCGLPILILAVVVPLLGSSSPKLSALLVTISPFICPIMMLSMILPMLLKKDDKKDNCCSKTAEDKQSQSIEKL